MASNLLVARLKGNNTGAIFRDAKRDEQRRGCPCTATTETRPRPGNIAAWTRSFLTPVVAVVDNGSMAAAERLINITPAAVGSRSARCARIGATLSARRRAHGPRQRSGLAQSERRRAERDVADLSAVATDSSTAGELRLGAGT